MPDMIHKSLDADLTLTEGDRCFVARMTSAVIDRDGEVCLPQGMVTTEFDANPAVFVQHDYAKMPVGKVLSIRRTPEANYAKVWCAVRPANHVGEWIPDTVYSLIQQGVLKGVSVGFMPIEQRKPTAVDKDTFGPDVVRVFSKWKLLELSIAPMPANQEALILAVSKSLITTAQAKSFGIPTDAMADAEEPILAASTPTSTPTAKAPTPLVISILDFEPRRPKPKKMLDVRVAVEQAIAKKMGKLFV